MATDPVGPFPLDALWASTPLGSLPSCLPPRPPGAQDRALEDIVTVAKNGFDPGERRRDGTVLIPRGSRRGEDLDCQEISCNWAEVIVPSLDAVVRVERYASEAIANPRWQSDPYLSLGWCQFTPVTWTSLAQQQVRITAGLKNWSEDRPRVMLLRVWLKA